MAAGAVGVLLDLAGVTAAVVSVLVVLFIVVAPTTAIAGLLRGFDGAARIILAGVTTLVILIALAMIMLSIGAWSPRGGLAALAVITAALFAARRIPAGRLSATFLAHLFHPKQTSQDRAGGATAAEHGSAGDPPGADRDGIETGLTGRAGRDP